MKKKLLKFTGLMIVVVALVGIWGYNQFFKPDPKVQQELKNQFGEDFFSSFGNNNVVKPPSPVSNNKPSTTVNSKEEANKNTEANEVISNNTNASETVTLSPVNDNSTSKPETIDEVKNKYLPVFNQLQNVALSRLDTLYSAAIQEYKQGSKTGTLNRSALIQKYMQAGTMLESNVDGQFNNTLSAMQNELVANNLPTDVVSSIRSEYEKAKSNMRAQLLSKVR